MANGVFIWDTHSTFIDYGVEIGEGTEILPHCVIEGPAVIGKNCKIGPFVHIRPSTNLGDNVKIGNFVELKNTSMGEGSAASHLSYLGDAVVGKGVNIGCGAVTVNYDGVNKHTTTIEDGAFVGCNANLIAPVRLGENSFVAAGSTISKDVPAAALGVARARQENKENWKSPRQRK